MSKNKLRFKDDNGNIYPNWIESKIKEVNAPVGSEVEVPNTYLEIGDIVPKTNRYKLDKNKVPVHGAKKAVAGTVLVSTVRPTRGAIALLKEDTKVSGALYQFKSDENLVCSGYINQIFLSDKFLNYLGSVSTGSTYPTVSSSDIDDYEIMLPSLPEQEKIAALFSKLDERIELREQKIASLKKYKKGLQQAVFGNNGERTLRFKDKNGNDYPDWVEKKLGEIATYVNKRGKIKDEHEYISVSNITRGWYDNSIKVARQDGILFESGDLLISNIRPYLKKYMQAKSSGIAANDILVLRTNKGILPLFMKHVLTEDSFWSYVMTGAKGSKMPRGDKAHILEYETAVPCFEEQEKIANLFSKIDNQIELEEALLQAAKDEKQGLMQRVF